MVEANMLFRRSQIQSLAPVGRAWKYPCLKKPVSLDSTDSVGSGFLCPILQSA